jgi:hypothetical protein
MDILAVGLGSPRPRPEVADPELAEERGEAGRVGVRPGVVGHHPLDTDAMASEEPDGLLDERDRALRELVRADRDVGDPARVVDRDVEIIVAALGVPASVVAEDPMTAAGWYPAETLHVDVDQLARSLPDIANRSPGQPICVSETAQAVAA